MTELRQWQSDGLVAWNNAGHRGIAAVVTGGGKTIFALACLKELRADTAFIVVPTQALLDQWWEEVASFFGLDLDEINIVSGRRKMKRGTVNIAVINTAARLVAAGDALPSMLIVDECHKAAAPEFRAVLDAPKLGSLGLSATPERQYDAGLDEILKPALGEIICSYDYRQALQDKVITPFDLINVVFELEPDRREKYEKLTRGIAVSISKNGLESEETIGLLLRRARVVNLSEARMRLALKLVRLNAGRRILIFHEDIDACDVIAEVLSEVGISSAVYHSRIPQAVRTANLKKYREGAVDVLVTCRALDEGFNVPQTQVGIIAASTATRRQRIQRLGRVLRPSAGKDRAVVYTLATTDAEIGRLKEEEADLEGVAEVTWSRG